MASLGTLLRGLVRANTSSVINRFTSMTSCFVLDKSSQFYRPISLSAHLFAEPLKKKKKMDPAVIRAREERKKRKLEKQIRRLEKHQSQYKPIDELEIPVQIVENSKSRERAPHQITTSEAEQRWLLQKEWGKYKFQQHSAEMQKIERMQSSQEKALNELRMESEELYIAAIAQDPSMIPLEINGPVDTPPIPDYQSLQGDFIDISRKWE